MTVQIGVDKGASNGDETAVVMAMTGKLAEDVLRISQEIKTQDGRRTEHPVFVVQRLVRQYGIAEDWAGDSDYSWVDDEDGEWIEAEPAAAARLDISDGAMIDCSPWRRVYYAERWEFVTACFTEEGCVAYLQVNGHRFGKTRIYVETGYRNREWQTIRKLLGSTQVERDHD